MNQSDPNAIFQQAVAFHRSGKLDEALELYRKLLELHPKHPVALAYLGMAQFQLGRLEDSVHSLQASVQIHSDQPEALSFLGSALQRLNRMDEAVTVFDQALAIRPDFVEVLVNRGFVLRDLKRFGEALADFDRAISLAPNHVEALNNRGLVLQDLGQYDEAVKTFEGAIALRPDLPALHNNLASALRHLARFNDALVSVDRAIALNPDASEPHNNRGYILQALKRGEEALESYNRAIALKPDFAEAWFGRGCILFRQVRLPQAVESFHQALAAMPDYALAEWALKFSDIPEIFAEAEDLEISRAAFSEALDELDAWFTPPRMDSAYEVVGSCQPFSLTYQERDNKALMSRYGRICHRLMAHWQNQRGYKSNQLSEKGKIRIGIVSTHIHNHSVWQAIIKGWIRNLDSDEFEIHIFYPGTKVDRETMLAQSMATSFIQGKHSLDEWVQAILGAHIEVLIYPEIGMGILTAQLANLRLAPIQVASWGHPDTTGFKTIDYFISAEDLEPENAESYYVEKLVKLPHLGCTYSPQDIVPTDPDLVKLGLNTKVPLLICPGVPFKYAPQYDWVLVEIAKRLGKCQFVFFTYTDNKYLSFALAERLRQAFRVAKLDFDDYGTFIPWLNQNEFYGLMRRADVFLDTLGFSGFNTAMQAVESALPIATLDGHFMRGRLASGILRRMGMPEMVATSEKDYISLAVRLAQDKNYSDEIRKQITAKRQVLYDDAEPVRTLGKFMTQVCRRNLK